MLANNFVCFGPDERIPSLVPPEIYIWVSKKYPKYRFLGNFKIFCVPGPRIILCAWGAPQKLFLGIKTEPKPRRDQRNAICLVFLRTDWLFYPSSEVPIRKQTVPRRGGENRFKPDPSNRLCTFQRIDTGHNCYVRIFFLT